MRRCPPWSASTARLRGSRCCSLTPAPTSPSAQDSPLITRPSTAARWSSPASSSTSGSPRCPSRDALVAAEWKDGKLTVWASTQNAQISRFILTALGLDPANIRVVAPDVGGGFGAKIGVDRDALIVAWAAKHTGRALRWAESRSENMLGMTHGRAQRHVVTIGGSRDGRVQAYRLRIVQDTGAYPRMGGFLPFLTSLMASGPYAIPHVETGYDVVVTNATPISAYRGAGRPEATAAVERAIDLFAAEIGMDPAEVRRINLVPADQFPFTTAAGRHLRHGRVRRGTRQGADRGRLHRPAGRAGSPP